MSTSTHRTPSGNFKGNSNGKNPGRFRANQPGTHTLAERGSDFYPTPRIAVESLLNAEPIASYAPPKLRWPEGVEFNVLRLALLAPQFCGSDHPVPNLISWSSSAAPSGIRMS